MAHQPTSSISPRAPESSQAFSSGSVTRVTAVEPDQAMLAELTRRHPEATALEGTAERIPLGNGEVDAVFVGQAFHWFDMPRALAELARVLRPGGMLGALWNHSDDRVPWISELPVLGGADTTPEWDEQRELAVHPAFTAVGKAVFDHLQRRTAESMTATIGTYSPMLVASGEERAAALGRVLEYLHSCSETADGEFDWPLRTLAVRARRR